MEELSNAPPNVDFYAILNVPRTASVDEIRSSYKRLAVTYHPDRHPPESGLRAEAKEKFTLIKTAYETLSDEKLRAIYDKYGTEGLSTGWELAAKTKSTEEILREFEKIKKREEERQLDTRVHARSKVIMDISLSELYDSLTGQLNLLEVTGMSLTQSVRVPFTERDEGYIVGMVRQQNGNGIGSLTARYRHIFNADTVFWSEITSTGSSHALQLGTWRRLTALWSAQIYGTIHNSGSGIVTSIDRVMSENTSSRLEYSIGYNPYLSLSLSKHKESFSTSADIRASFNDLSAGIEFAKRFSKKTNGKFGARIDWHGNPEVSIGGTRKISKYSKIGLELAVQPESLYLNVTFSRSTHKLILPILITREVTMKNVISSIAVPTTLLILFKYLYLDPQNKIKKKNKIERLRKETSEQRANAKKNAESAIRLMISNVQRKVSNEESKRGLIIIYACYGNLESYEKDESGVPIVNKPLSRESFDIEPRVIDVTIPLQYLVEDSQLHLHDTSKSQHLGFYDPCPGEDKSLYIRYLFKDKLHEVTIDDTQAIGLPLASHAIRSS